MIPSLNTELERLQTAVRADVAVILDRVIGTTESFAALTLPQGLLEPELAWPLVNEMPPALTLVSDPRRIAYLVPTEARVQMSDVVRAALWVELTPALVLVLIWSRNAPPETLAHTLDERLRGDLLLLAADWVERRRDRLTIQRLSSTVQAMTDALVTVDDLHGVAHLNPVAAALLGLPGETRIPSHLLAQAMERLQSRLLNPENAHIVASALQADPVGAVVQHVLWQFAESPLFLSVSTSPLPHGRLWVFSDVSEREAAIQAEAQISRRYRFIAENSKDMILCIAPTGKRTYVSPFAYELTGYTPDELMAEPRVAITHPDEYRAGGEAFQKAILSGANYFQIEQRIRHKDGHYVWTALSTTLVRDPQTGALVETIGIAHDITERKEAEQRQMELQLEQERTELLSRFIRDAAHEFRTPLSVIGSASYLLLRSDKPEVRQRKFDSIEKQIKRITSLLDSLLLMVRVDSHDTLEKSPVGIGLILLSECQHAQDAYGNHPVMRQTPFPYLSDVMGDASLLMDAFRQILDNAMRFTPEDGSVTVEAGMEGDHLWVQVADTGIGIAPENLRRVFDTFWRHDDAHLTTGFGLGLPIAKRIIERHGGTIALKSQLGQGTQVRVTLPVGGNPQP